MPSVYDLKPKFQNMLRPLTTTLAEKGVTANQVTVAAAALSAAVGALLCLSNDARWLLLLVPVTMLVRMAMNAIDGMLAREFNQKSDLGAILNELGDVVADACLYLPFALIDGIPAVAIVFFVLGATITEMTGVIGIQIGASRRYDGPMGKSDRAVAIAILSLYLGFGGSTGLLVNIVIALVCLGLVLTVKNRATGALQELNSSTSN